MRVAFLISSMNAGGAEKVVSILANKISQTDKVFIITLNKGEPFFQLDSRIEIIQCGVYNEKGGNLIKGIISNFIIILKLMKIIKLNAIDHIICFMTTSNVLGTIAGKIMMRKVTISERANPNFEDVEKWDFLRKLVYKFADQMVVQSKEFKDFFTSYVNPQKIKVIYNPVLYKKIDFSKKEKVILTVGRCDENKNQKLIIRSFAKINDDSWKLIICGEGPLIYNLKELVANLNIEKNVRFLGNIKNVNHYYRKASIFMLSSISEGFPNVLLEAMSFGCACISTDCPSGPNIIIDDNINGSLIPLNNEDEYFKCLKDLIIDDIKRDKFGRNALEKSKSFSIDEIVEDWNLN